MSPSFSTLLALDLSTARGTLAVMGEGGVLFSEVFQSERSHNAQVFGPLSAALSLIGETERVLLVVGTGPGSYTGVRIAIAALQGVSLARDWPLVAVPSLLTAPLQAYSVLGDARRGQLYYAKVNSGRWVQEPIILTEAEGRAKVAEGGSWVSFDAKVPCNINGVDLVPVDAVRLAEIAALYADEWQRQPTVEPFYLQEAFITQATKAGKQVK